MRRSRTGAGCGAGGRRVAGVAAAVAMAFAASPASAFKFDTGSDDLVVRWDNTVKYNIGWRVEGRDNKLGDAWVSQATNHGWDKGEVVTNRFDLLSEFDLVYKLNHGFRISATGWSDLAFDEDVKGHPAYQRAGLGTAYPRNKFTSDVKRWYGTSGELLDAFAFTRVDLGSVPVNIRAGRHNVYWGESLYTFGNSIAYGQGPLDLRKATSTPGIEAKELFLPQNQISAAGQLTDKVSVAANYYLEWDPHRLPEGGTYLGGADLSFLGGTNFLGFPVLGDRDHGPHKKPGNTGSWGVMSKIKSDTLGGDLGLYYRRFDDRYPTMIATPQGLVNAYAEDVKLYGVSFSRLVGAVSVSGELSRREDTPLASNAGGLALGSTWHGLLNMIAYIGQTPLFDSAAVTAEISYSRLDDVNRSTRAFFKHKDSKYGGCTGGVKAGCATDDAWGFNIGITPTWFQVLPGIDLTMPVNFGIGLKGNSPAPLGAAQDAGAWSIGLGLDIYSKYNVNLTYNDYIGNYTTGPNITPVPGVGARTWEATNGAGILRDRGWVSLTFKTVF